MPGTMSTMPETFDTALAAFVKHAQSVVDANTEAMAARAPNVVYGDLNARKVEVTEGGRAYVRVVISDVNGSSRSVYCFVGRATGDIYFPKSWKAPSLKTPRGNIYRPETFTCATPYGIAYLRK